MRMRPDATIGWLLLAIALALSVSAGAQPPGDVDSDGTPDVEDICTLDPLAPDPLDCDTDMDGFGNACDGDYDNDGTVGAPDYPTYLEAYGSTGAPGFHVADHNCDGTVGVPDSPVFVRQLGGPPGPSGLPCAGTVPCP